MTRVSFIPTRRAMLIAWLITVPGAVWADEART